MSELDLSDIEDEDSPDAELPEAKSPAIDLSDLEDDDQTGQLLSEKYNSANSNPDDVARAKTLADKTGLPMVTVMNQPDKAAKIANRPDWTSLSKTSPVTAKKLANDGTFFQIAHDDHSALSKIEQGLVGLGVKASPLAPVVSAASAAGDAIKAMTGFDFMGNKDDVGTVVRKYGENMGNQATKTLLGNVMAADSAIAQFLAPNAGEGINGWYYRQNKDQIDGVVDEIVTLAGSVDPAAQNTALRKAQEYGLDSIPRYINKGNEINRQALLESVIYKQASENQSSTNTGIIDKNRRRNVLLDMIKDEDKILQENAADVDAYTVPWLVSNSLQFVQQMAQGAAGSVVAGPAGAATMFGGSVFGNEYATGKAAGKTDDDAATDAGASALIEGATELIGLRSIEDVTKGLMPILKGIGRATGINFSQEQGAEIAGQLYDGFANQEFVERPDYIDGMDAPDQVKDFLAILDRQLQAGVIGAFGGGTSAAGAVGVQKTADIAIEKLNQRRQASANEASETQKKLVDSFNAVSGSLLGKRDKKSLSELMDAVAQDEGNAAPTHMLVSADVFKQGGIDPEVFKTAVPSVAMEIDQAIQLGGTVSVPVGELFTGFAGTGMEQTLTEHMKVSEDAWTAFEAGQQKEQEALDQFAAEAEKIRAQQADRDTWDAQARHVYDSVLFDLNGAGNFDKKANKAYATLVRDFYSVLAPKVGKTPDQLFKEAPLSVFGRMQGNGAVLNQSGYSDEEANFFNSMGIDLGGERSNVNTRTGENGERDGNAAANRAQQDIQGGGSEGRNKTEAGERRRLRKLSQQSFRDDAAREFGEPVLNPRSTEPGYRQVTRAGTREITADHWSKAAAGSASGTPESAVGVWAATKESSAAAYGDVLRDYIFHFKNPIEITAEDWASLRPDTQEEGFSLRENLLKQGIDGIIITGHSQYNHVIALHPDAVVKASESRLSENYVDYSSLESPTVKHFDADGNEVFYQKNDGHRAAFDPSSLNIYLLETADLTSFLHETGHFFLEMYSRYADQSADVAQDMDALLKWFGIAGETDVDRRQAWSGMDLEAQRKHHEKFAESFEQYLFEGKAPNVELQSLFDTFGRWLTSVYKSLLDVFRYSPAVKDRAFARFLASHDGAKLTPEVRGVMDRMIATREQILDVAEVRASKAMFTTQEQSGMTDAQWKAYQEDQKRSIEQPITELTARSLRDMRFMSNAKGKELKKLQREAASLRRESRMDARRDVLSQKEYRVWLFLKRQTEGKTAKRVKSKELDPSVDSLYAAIAKLGGLNKIAAIAQWGIDPKDYDKKSGVFGMPVLRNDGGLTPDGMTEALSQFGYLPLDEHGKASMVDLEELLFREYRGEKVYSTWADYEYLLYGDKPPTPDVNDIDYIGGRLDRAALLDMYGTNNPDVRWHAPASVAPDGTFQQPAYHGSPYKFDKFSLAHMGKGEGAQAYGWGLYFAGSKEVGEYYRNALSDTKFISDGRALYDNEAWAAQFLLTAEPKMNAEAAKKAASVAISQESEYGRKTTKEIHGLIDDLVKTDLKESAGQLYKVEIPEDDTYLLWDKPISEQPAVVKKAMSSAKIKNAVKKAGYDVNDLLAEGIYKLLSQKVLGSQEAASKLLHSLGVSGIKYLDGVSRDKGDGNYNYVVFDDNAVQVLETFYQKGDSKDDKGPGRSLEGMGMVSNDGLHPDVVADLFGFSSGDELVRKLLTIDDPMTAIEKRTDELMMQRHSEFTDPKALERMAEAAIHNEARVRFVATELAMLNKAMGGVNVILKAAKMYASEIISGQKIGDIRPAKHAADAARAGREADRMLAKGKTADTVMAKRNQVLHAELARQAHEAKDDIEKTRKFFAKIALASNKKNVTRGRDPDVMNAITAIVAQYGFYPAKESSALEYLKIVEKNDPEMAAMLKPAVEQAMMDAKPYQKMTVSELRGLRSEVESLWYLAKRSRGMEVDGKLLDLEDAASSLMERMNQIGIPDSMPGQTSAITPKESAVRQLQYAGAALRRVEQWAEAKDGAFGGPFLRLIFQPVKVAADSYRRDRATYRKKFTSLVESLPMMKRGVIEAPELGYTFGKGDQKVGMAELLHAVLHAGNESNKRKMLLGRGWASLRDDGTINTSRWDSFLSRAVREGLLQKAHFDFAQGVWDLLEETKPLAQKTHREVFGRYFDEVAADQFGIQFPNGETVTYRGGYVPAQVDSRLVNDAAIRELAESENQNMSYSFPATSKGFTMSRVEYNRPLLLNISALAQHIDKVLLFAHMEPAVRDVARLLKRGDVSEPLSRIDPAAYSGMLLPWLNRAARQVVETPLMGDGGMSRVLSTLRNRAGMGLMFGNVSNTLQQITGISSALVKVKGSHMRRAAAQYIANPKAMADAVSASSDFMRNRIDNEIAAITEQMNQILLDPTLYEKSKEWTQKHAYFLQSAFDNVVSPIVWTAAYNQAVTEGMTDVDSGRFADGVVRQTQGTTLPEDVSRIETGPAYARVFTQFIGYFNMVANTNATELKKIAQDVGLKRGAGRGLGILFYGVLAPAWVAEAIAIALRGGPEDEDDDGYLDDWLSRVIGMGSLKFMLAGVPFVGQFANAGIARFNNNPLDDRVSLSPAVSLLESAVGAPHSIYKAIVDDGNKRKAVRDVASLVTLATGLPAIALARPVGYMVGIADDKIEPTNVIDFTRGAVTGVPSPESVDR